MLAVHVFVHVKPDCIESFKHATIVNAQNSIKEPGIARFDIIQHTEDPSRFVLIEVYRSQEATIAHKSTQHYETWRDTVAPMMAEPRTSVKYHTVFPTDSGW